MVNGMISLNLFIPNDKQKEMYENANRSKEISLVSVTEPDPYSVMLQEIIVMWHD